MIRKCDTRGLAASQPRSLAGFSSHYNEQLIRQTLGALKEMTLLFENHLPGATGYRVDILQLPRVHFWMVVLSSG